MKSGIKKKIIKKKKIKIIKKAGRSQLSHDPRDRRPDERGGVGQRIVRAIMAGLCGVPEA